MPATPPSRPAPIPTRLTRLTGNSGSRVSAGHARPDSADDGVRDRAHPIGPLLGGDVLVALASDQHDLVAHLDRLITYIDHELVHRDRSRDRVAVPADQHLAAVVRELTGNTVGVPNRHRRDE